MNSENPSQESSVLDAHIWISICRAFNTLDFELQPDLYDVVASNYPITQVYYYLKTCEDPFRSLKDKNLSLHDASMEIIKQPFKHEESFKSIDDYIKYLLDASNKSDYVIFHASPLKQLMNHLIVRFNRKIWSRYSSPAISFSIENNLPTRSFLDALINVSLLELKKVEENENLKFSENAFIESELLVRAACTLLKDLSLDIQLDPNILASLFSNIVHICQIPYESRPTKGSAIVTADTLSYDIAFNSPILLEDHLAARKTFEMSKYGASIITDGNKVFGIKQHKNDIFTSAKNSILIKIHGYGHWDVSNSNGVLFEVKHGIPRLPRPQLSRNDFERALELFSGLSLNIDELWSVVNAAKNAEHGTIIIISSNPIAEALRLQPQATLITPTILPKDLLSSVFAIDGALLLGPEGICHAVGVILDGEISKRGTKSRGSRYNSSIRYIDSNPEKAIAFVVSEDGHINLIIPEK